MSWYDPVSTAWDSLFSSTSEAASSFADSVVDTSSSFYAEAKDLYNQGEGYVEAKVQEAKDWLDKLAKEQEAVDTAIDAMPEGADKEAMKAKRDESRGFFSDYVLPLAKKFKTEEQGVAVNMVQDSANSSFTGSSEFGFLPVVPLAVGGGLIAAAAAIVYYCQKSYAFEDAILSDPKLTSAQKAALIIGVANTGMFAQLNKLKYPLLGIVALIVGYQVYKGMKK